MSTGEFVADVSEYLGKSERPSIPQNRLDYAWSSANLLSQLAVS